MGRNTLLSLPLFPHTSSASCTYPYYHRSWGRWKGPCCQREGGHAVELGIARVRVQSLPHPKVHRLVRRQIFLLQNTVKLYVNRFSNTGVCGGKPLSSIQSALTVKLMLLLAYNLASQMLRVHVTSFLRPG